MTEEHVPVENLAAYAAGDLDATAALEVEAHVLLCERCRADADAVNRATAALASLEPLTMPADVAARVDAAVAAADTPTGPVGDVLPIVPKRRRPTWAGVAAVAAGFALVGAITVPFVTGAGDRGSGGTAAMDSREMSGPRRLQSGLNYTHGEIGPTLLRALGGQRDEAGQRLALRQVNPKTGVGEEAGAPAASLTPGAARDSGALYSAGDQSLVPFSSNPARLDACVQALGDGLPAVGRTPLVVDFGLFDGKPALVVVFPTVRAGEVRTDRIDVFVVGPRCGITPGDDDVLDFARFQRPSNL